MNKQAVPEADIIAREYETWKSNINFLYNYVVEQVLEWPSLTIEWLPTYERDLKNELIQREVYLGTQTGDNALNSIIKASINQNIHGKVNTNGDKCDDVSASTDDNNSFRITQRISHEGDVNKLRQMPQNSHILATQSSHRTINIINANVTTSCVNLHGHKQEGFGLDWSRIHEGYLASGCDDGRVCIWDIAASIQMKVSPIVTYEHAYVIEDVSWSEANESLVGASGDDGSIRLYDIRQSEECQKYRITAHTQDCNVVRFNPFNSNLLISASSDSKVALWDLRNSSYAVHWLEGHTDSVVCGVWSPHKSNMLATSGVDRRVIVWDLSRIGCEQSAEEAEDGGAEVLFVHGGHTSIVNDVSWDPINEWMVASVANDNVIQVWEMADTIYNDMECEDHLDDNLLE